jgi:hypothetical protein
VASREGASVVARSHHSREWRLGRCSAAIRHARSPPMTEVRSASRPTASVSRAARQGAAGRSGALVRDDHNVRILRWSTLWRVANEQTSIHSLVGGVTQTGRWFDPDARLAKVRVRQRQQRSAEPAIDLTGEYREQQDRVGRHQRERLRAPVPGRPRWVDRDVHCARLAPGIGALTG